MYIRKIEKETSVKTIGVLSEPTPAKSGVCDFIYRPQYSVFDWGKMPMPEGASLDNRPVALVAAFNFELLESKRILTCYLGTVDARGKAHPLDWCREHNEVPVGIQVRMVNVLRPSFDPVKGEWNYDVFKAPPVKNYVHPIEFIWRGAAGPDSSFWKNIARGAYKLTDFGLPADLKPGSRFESPVLDHSSKYEDHDRYFSPEKARELANIDKERWKILCAERLALNQLLFEHARDVGIYRPDGKQEFVTTNSIGQDYVGDVAGTWHEDRFLYQLKSGKWVKVSKQVLRDLNKLRNPEWAKECEEAKPRAEKERIANWKELVVARPAPLEHEFFSHYNNLMYAATNAWVGWSAFPEASPLEEACQEFEAYRKDYEARLRKAA